MEMERQVNHADAMGLMILLLNNRPVVCNLRAVHDEVSHDTNIRVQDMRKKELQEPMHELRMSVSSGERTQGHSDGGHEQAVCQDQPSMD